MKPPIPVKFGKNPRETEKQLDFALRDIYNRIGQVEQTIQPPSQTPFKVITATGGEGPGVIPVGDSKIVTPTYDQDAGRLPLVTPVVPETVYIAGKTLAESSQPIRNFVGLSVIPVTASSTTQVHIDAKRLVVINSLEQTTSCFDVSDTCDITAAGPIINGRDQAAAFAQYDWLYWYVIYSSGLRTTKTLVSLSSTTPTLPSGYDFWMRVGCGWCDLANHLLPITARDGWHWWRNSTYPLVDGDVGVAYTWTEVDLSRAIPPTAKMMFGTFGGGTGTAANREMDISPTSDGLCQFNVTITGNSVSAVHDYSPYNGMYFIVPVLTSQKIYYTGSVTNLNMNITINGWIDDL